MAKPAAETSLSIELVLDLLRSQHPDIAQLPITEAASGWDNTVFRLGEEMAVRLPRHAIAATSLESEQRWLPLLQAQIPLPIPTPIRVGRAQQSYPWRWSVTPWIEGVTADRSVPGRDQARVLAAFFDALHRPAPADAPHNADRGVPLSRRHADFVRCIASLTERGYAIDDRLLELWSDASARPVDVSPTWIHGDLHPRNVLLSQGRICGVIDWGDIAQGDRATDLAALWMLFPERDSREEVIATCKFVSSDTWQRARGWALLLSVVVLEEHDPALAELAERTMERLLD